MKRILLVLAAYLSFGLATPVSAYSEVIVFGDSLVDSGNARQGALEQGFPDIPADPADGYYKGRFSNGYNFADDLSLYILQQPARAYLKGGLNFGVGGAAAALYDPPAISPSFLEQIALFGSTGHMIKSDSLIILTFGGNDIRDVVTNTSPIEFADTLADFRTGLQLLIGAGARNILLTGVPDIGALPATFLTAMATSNPAIVPLATQRSQFLNEELQKIVADPLYTGVDLDFFDLYGLEQAIRTDPEAYGLPVLNTLTPCVFAGSATCDGFLYFDVIHPTKQVHKIIARQIAAQLGIAAVPEPASWAMMIAGLAVIGAMLRTRRPVLRLA